jgi:hypothetical protein
MTGAAPEEKSTRGSSHSKGAAALNTTTPQRAVRLCIFISGYSSTTAIAPSIGNKTSRRLLNVKNVMDTPWTANRQPKLRAGVASLQKFTGMPDVLPVYSGLNP